MNTPADPTRPDPPMAEAVLRELDRRFILPLRRAAAMKPENDLAAWWQEQGAFKDLPGALSATLTHARCTPALENQVLGQVHMVQHPVGMATRVELARFEALIDENVVLSRERTGAQQRSTRQALDHARQLEPLQSELVRVRGQAMAAHSVTEGLRRDLREQIEAANETVAAIDSHSNQDGKAATHPGRHAAGVARTGKRCVFVKTPSRAALERALADAVQAP